MLANQLAQEVLTEALQVFKPIPKLTVDKWADGSRVMTTKTSAFPGPWDTEMVPYLREPMECFTDPLIEKIVLWTACQVGKTEALLNSLGYVVDVSPGPTMFLLPTDNMIKKFSRTRIDTLFAGSPVLTGKVSDARSRAGGNTMYLKEFSGGHLLVAGANSRNDVSSDPICNLFADEIDRMPDEIKGEGDPIALAEKRTTTFSSRGKVFLTSTATIAGDSRIEREFNAGDMRYYHVPCVHCGAFQLLNFDQVKWPKDKDGKHLTKKAYYECPHCGGAINEIQKKRMVRLGEWRATQPFNGIASFGGLGTVYSWFLKMSKLAKEFLDAKDDPAKLKTFYNTRKGEVFEERGLSVNDLGLYDRREDYELIPRGAALLTIAVDVQGDRLEACLAAWGRGQEVWLMDFRVFYGDPKGDDVWNDLWDYINVQHKHESGNILTVKSVTIDTGGHHTRRTYEFINAMNDDRIHGVKGAGQTGYTANPREFVGRPSKNNSGGILLYTLGVDKGKDTLFSRLKVEEPGPGYVHFNKKFDKEFFEQLKAEKRVSKKVNGRTLYVWKQKAGKRNEAIDLLNYHYAAYAIFNPIDMNQAIEELNAVEVEEETAIQPPPSRAPKFSSRGNGFVNNWK